MTDQLCASKKVSNLSFRSRAIPIRSSLGVRNANDLAEVDREIDDLADVRQPLLLIGVEQTVVRLAVEDERQLPGRVPVNALV